MTTMEQKLNQELLKFAVQRAIACQNCKGVLDCETDAVLMTGLDGKEHIRCINCYYTKKAWTDRQVSEVLIAPKAPKYYPVPNSWEDVPVSLIPIGPNRSEDDGYFTDGRIILLLDQIDRSVNQLRNRKFKGGKCRDIPLDNISEYIERLDENHNIHLEFSKFKRIPRSFFEHPAYQFIAEYEMGWQSVWLNPYLVRFIGHLISGELELRAFDPVKPVGIYAQSKPIGCIMPLRKQ